MKKQTQGFKQLQWQDLDLSVIVHLIRLAKAEDLEGAGLLQDFPYLLDVTSDAMLEPGVTGCSKLMARKDLVVCGVELVPLVLDVYGGNCEFRAECNDGDRLRKGQCIGTLEGDVIEMLQAERVLLNFLQKLSGISTLTSTYVQALAGSTTRVLDTRKTTPGYRVLEKYATACGGGWNHRRGLYEWILVKDNHLSGAKATEGDALAEKVSRAKMRYPDVWVEVEVDRMEQIPPVLQAGADIIMLDNFDNSLLKEAVELIGGRAITEASGGVEVDRLPAIGRTGVDFVSTGATVHQSQWIDIGLDWVEV